MSLVVLTLLLIVVFVFIGLYRTYGNPFNPRNVDWRVTAILLAASAGIVLFALFGQPINQPKWLTDLQNAYNTYLVLQKIL
ncbi:MAG: hypothetical protein ACTSWP_09785 [Candidatus Freyarchaeota archaeon]|nr:hypothetical protein [Candidatus Freyrarchaeum guaymaensis]